MGKLDAVFLILSVFVLDTWHVHDHKFLTYYAIVSLNDEWQVRPASFNVLHINQVGFLCCSYTDLGFPTNLFYLLRRFTLGKIILIIFLRDSALLNNDTCRSLDK